jgi:predicted site-specific integrase-resolvase
VRLTAAQFAEALGVKTSTLDAYIARGYIPQPDERVGRRRYWNLETVVKVAASRPGQGSRTDLS